MGDVIHALPVASAIHSGWPTTQITWIIDPRWQPLLDHHPAIHSTIPFPREKFRGPLGILRAFRWFSELRTVQPAIAVDLQGLLRSGITAWSSRARITCGLSDSRELAGIFHSIRVPVDPNEHAVDRYFRVLPALGIAPDSPKYFTICSDLMLPISSLSTPYILLHPFARGGGKSLNGAAVSAFIAASALLADIPIRVIGFGSFESDWSRPGVEDWTNRTTMAELVRLIRESAFVVSVDSGPMHLAAALGRPLLGIHTWSDPRRVGPYGKAWIWQGGEIRNQDLNDPPRPERPFTEDDARSVARFVAGQLG